MLTSSPFEYRQYPQSLVALGFERYPLDVDSQLDAYSPQVDPGGDWKIVSSDGRHCTAIPGRIMATIPEIQYVNGAM